MELSAFSVVDAFPPGTGAGRDRYAELLELGDAAEAAGLSTLWIAEHHFNPGGTVPVPAVLFGALSQRTHRLRLGSLVTVLPFHNPIEVAEQVAMVDRLTNGRYRLGVGSGYIPLEFDGFGVDPSTKRERFDQALDIVLAALAGEEVRYPPGIGTPVRLNVEPVQRPHPPLYIAVQRREALPFVARRGASVALIPYATVETIDELGEEIREFRLHLAPDVRVKVAIGLHVYTGPEPDQARAAFQRYLDGRRRTQSSFYLAKVHADPRHASAEHVERSGFALFGSAEEVADRLAEFERIGVDELLGIFDFGGLGREEVLTSVASLGAQFRSSSETGP